MRSCLLMVALTCEACGSVLNMVVPARDEGPVWVVAQLHLAFWFDAHHLPKSYVLHEVLS